MLGPVRVPSILQRHPALGWALPAGVIVAVAVAATGVFTTQSSSAPLPQTNPQAIVAALTARDGFSSGFSGTILAQLSFDLPAVGGTDGDASTSSARDLEMVDSSTLALVTGTHTMRYWYGGPQRQRVALLGPDSEIDVFRDGAHAWQWNSDTEVATKSAVPVDADLASAPLTFGALTPLELTARVLAAVDPATTITLDEQRQVAHRPCYDLVITPPRDAKTRIGSAHIAVDGATTIPLGVQIYARGSDSPSIDVSFTSLTVKMPSPDYFAFSPPPGAAVSAGSIAALTPSSDRTAATLRSEPTVANSGWGAIDSYRVTGALDPAGLLPSIGDVPAVLQPVSGVWGAGRLFVSPLLCVLILDDGRMFIGAVEPSALFAAAAG